MWMFSHLNNVMVSYFSTILGFICKKIYIIYFTMNSNKGITQAYLAKYVKYRHSENERAVSCS